MKIKPLGKGSFGSAILIKRRSDNQLLVVKEVNLSKMSAKEREEARNECKVLQQLNHPNIVRYMEHYEQHGVLYIIMEYADGGDLAQKIKEAAGRGLREDTVMYYTSQLCLALEYLHSRHILHRDIKTMNIFLMKNGTVKLGDFGISTILRNTMGMANTVCGTPYYFSPELCKNKPYNNRSDVWALGVVLYELMTSKHPFDANSMQQLMQRIVKSSYAPVSSTYSKELRQLLDMCLQKDPMRRPTIKQVIAHPCVRRAFEKLETDLMLATQCRVRLQDIIDFPAKGSGRSSSPSCSPAPSGSSGSSGQRSGALDAAKKAPSISPPPPQRTPQQVPMPPPPVVPRDLQQHRPSAAPTHSNQLRADLDRVDAFIKQLNQPVNDKAKDAIQEYMRRKQEELAERKRKEAEMLKKQEERNAELRRVMEEHQKQMLEQAKQRLQRQAQASPQQVSHQTPPPRALVPQALYHAYGVPTPRKKEVKHAIAANSPAQARRIISDGGKVISAAAPPVAQQPAAAIHPRPLNHLFQGVPQQAPNKAQMAERAQNWADRQAEKRKQELESAQLRKLDDDRRMVRDLPDQHVRNRVLDPELEAWVQRQTSGDPPRMQRLGSPQSSRQVGASERDEVPAGVDARRRAASMSPSAEALRHASAADAVFKEHGHSQPTPHTPPPVDRKVDFRRGTRPTEVPSAASSRSSSVSSQGNAMSSVALRCVQPSDVPADPLDHTPDFQSKTSPHLSGGALRHESAIPMVRYPVQPSEEIMDVPDIIRSLRGPVVLDGPPSTLEVADVPLAAYEIMLGQIKQALEKTPTAVGASNRHHAALSDADVLDDVAEVLETEAFMLGGDEDDDDEDESDFEDEEPITPSHPFANDSSPIGTAASMPACDPENSILEDEEPLDLTLDFFLRHLCGSNFHGQCAVHPSTGLPLFPSESVSRNTNEFQLQVTLEKRLSAGGLETVLRHLRQLPVGSASEGRHLEELRGVIAMQLAKVKRCPTSAVSAQEAGDALAMCAQLLFFRE